MKTAPHTGINLLALVIKKCAFEMNAHDKAEIDKRKDAGEDLTFYRGVTSGPDGIGRRICEETARGMAAEALAIPAYLLLAYAWNDALDWADKQLSIEPDNFDKPGAPKMQTIKKWGG